mgnify:CR=1 FL=1
MNINQKTTLLILMNFSSISSNFAYLMEDCPDKIDDDQKQNHNDGITIRKQDFINVVNHLIDGDRFSQILIQRLLINFSDTAETLRAFEYRAQRSANQKNINRDNMTLALIRIK